MEEVDFSEEEEVESNIFLRTFHFMRNLYLLDRLSCYLVAAMILLSILGNNALLYVILPDKPTQDFLSQHYWVLSRGLSHLETARGRHWTLDWTV